MKYNKILKQNSTKHLNEIQQYLKTPKFLAIVTGGRFAYTREDRVKILPIGTLR